MFYLKKTHIVPIIRLIFIAKNPGYNGFRGAAISMLEGVMMHYVDFIEKTS